MPSRIAPLFAQLGCGIDAMSDSASKKNLEIEFLRGLAVLFTLFSHLPELLPRHGESIAKVFQIAMPWTGVDLFFCISGFVVSKAYFEYFDQHRRSGTFFLAAQAFWLRRAFRLIPSAWFWVLAGLVCSAFFNTTGVFGTLYENIRSATAVMTFSGNLANQFGVLLHPNDVYWSLALEEQFYLLFPLFLLWCPEKWRWPSLLLLISLQFVLNRNPFGTPLSALLNSFRLDALMWGVLIYMLSTRTAYRQLEPTFLKNSSVMRGFIFLVLIYLLVAIPAQLIAMPIAVGLIAIVSAVIVFLASFDAGYLPKIPILTPMLIWLGARSYGTYLLHVFVYRFTIEIWSRYAEMNGQTFDGRFTLRLVLTAALLIVVLAQLNYQFIETPWRKRGVRLARERLAEAEIKA